MRSASFAFSRRPQRLECVQVETISLDDDPIFIALSYVWGDETNREDIWVEGQRVSVTSSLASGLRAVRDTYGRFDDSNESIDIWADALCINQADLPEKTHQVAQMGRIYSQATLVAAWLGHAADESDRAIDAIVKLSDFMAELDQLPRGSFLIHRLANSVPRLEKIARRLLQRRLNSRKRVFGWVGRMPELMERSPDGAVVPSLDTEGWTSRTVKAIADFLSRPYWSRVWTYQELALSKEAGVLCGSKIIDLQRILLLNAYREVLKQWLLTQMRDSNLPAEYMIAAQVSEASMSIYPIVFMRRLAAQGRVLRFSETIEAILTRKSSNPLDMVYGILALTDSDLQPDYTITASTLYMQTMMTWLLQTGLLSGNDGENGDASGSQDADPLRVTHKLPLYLAGTERHYRDDLASWVHDLTNPTQVFLPPPHCRVSGDTTLESALASIQHDRLVLRGHLVGEVKRIWKIKPALVKQELGVQAAEKKDSFTMTLPRIISTWLKDSELPISRDVRIFDQLRDTASTGWGHVMAIFSQKPIAPGSSDDHIATRVFLDYINTSFRCAQIWAGLQNTGPPSNVQKLMDERIAQLPARYRDYDDSTTLSSPQFTMNDTATSWVGYATNGSFVRADGRVEAGDLIYAVPGHPAPFVLRRRENHFQLITWAYVSGIMRGEVVGDDEEAWLASLETLEIR